MYMVYILSVLLVFKEFLLFAILCSCITMFFYASPLMPLGIILGIVAPHKWAWQVVLGMKKKF